MSSAINSYGTNFGVSLNLNRTRVEKRFQHAVSENTNSLLQKPVLASANISCEPEEIDKKIKDMEEKINADDKFSVLNDDLINQLPQFLKIIFKLRDKGKTHIRQ